MFILIRLRCIHQLKLSNVEIPPFKLLCSLDFKLTQIR